MKDDAALLPDYKWAKRPIAIEAFRLAFDPIPDWFMNKVSRNEIILRGGYGDLQWCEIMTLEGVMIGNRGDYIIKGVKGEVYPCKPDIFEITYTRPQPEPVAVDTEALDAAEEFLSVVYRVIAIAKMYEADETSGENYKGANKSNRAMIDKAEKMLRDRRAALEKIGGVG